MMALYFVRFVFKEEALKGLVERPIDRVVPSRQFLELQGGKLHGFWWTHTMDAVMVYELPDAVDQAVTQMIARSGGAVERVEIMPLITNEQAIEAMLKAGEVEKRYKRWQDTEPVG
jgi:uncharacterized protein with GYD domain